MLSQKNKTRSLKLKSEEKNEKEKYDTYWKGTVRIIPEESHPESSMIKKWILKFCELFS